MSADPNIERNSLRGKVGNNTMQIILGMFFTLLSLFIISSSTKSEKGSSAEGINGHLLEEDEKAMAKKEAEEAEMEQ